MDYHNPHSDLFQMATEPWCDDYVSQYGHTMQYPQQQVNSSSFAYTLGYDEVSQPVGGVHVTPQAHHVTPNQASQQNYALQSSPMSQSHVHVPQNHVSHIPQTTHVTRPSNYTLYSSVPYEDVYIDPSSSSSEYLLTQPYMEAVTSTTTSPSDYDTPHASSSSSSVSVASRKQPESRMSQPELFSRMGLSHDPEEARHRENRVLALLKSRGFKLGEQTWIRDTTPAVRQEIVDFIHATTVAEYGYSKYMIEVVIRRACYHLMQGRLRRIRRARKSKGQ